MNYNYLSEKELDNIDWSFPSFGNSGIHSIHWYPATFISAIPGSLIPLFTGKNDIVLDPFCGSGTTGVEALRLGRKFIGVDNNPIALLITNSKLYHPTIRNIRSELERIMSINNTMTTDENIKNHPQYNELRSWYHPDTLAELGSIFNSILNIRNKGIRYCFLSVFSGILKNTCSQGKHWGWVCDNVKPKSSEINYKDAFTSFYDASEDYILSVESSYDSIRTHSSVVRRDIIRKNYSLYSGSCLDAMRKIGSDSIDFIMTSPPYYGVADYVKSQRLSYLWFDVPELNRTQLGFKDFETLRTTEAGSRSHRHRKNSHQLYIEFLNSFFSSSKRVLKPGSCVALVVGESKSRKETTDDLIECASTNDLCMIFRKQRDIRINKRRLMAKVQGEDVLVFQKK